MDVEKVGLIMLALGTSWAVQDKLHKIFLEIRSIRRMMNSDRDIDWSDEFK